MDREVAILKIRDLLAEKEAIVANMNRDIAEYGRWSTDWNKATEPIDSDIKNYFLMLA